MVASHAPLGKAGFNYGHHRSDRIFEVLSPACGIRDEQKKRGITPTNHARDNVMRIRAMEKLMRERKEAAVQAAVAAKAKPKTYQAVTPRVFSERPSSAPPPPKPPMEPRNFACPKPSGPAGRIFTAWEPPPLMREGAPAVYGTGARREKLKPTVPRREPPPPKPAPVDFVKRNADLSCLTPRKAPGSPASPPGTSEKSKYHGRVPPYLLDRKMELASKAAAKEAAAAPRDCPEGTHILPEEERQRVLALVREGQAKCHAELDKMPFVVDTFGLKEKQNSLSKQLAQLDAAEQAFSRSKVVVQDDAPVTPPTSPARALLALPAGAPAASAAAAPVPMADLSSGDDPDFTAVSALADEANAMAAEVGEELAEGLAAVDLSDD